VAFFHLDLKEHWQGQQHVSMHSLALTVLQLQVKIGRKKSFENILWAINIQTANQNVF